MDATRSPGASLVASTVPGAPGGCGTVRSRRPGGRVGDSAEHPAVGTQRVPLAPRRAGGEASRLLDHCDVHAVGPVHAHRGRAHPRQLLDARRRGPRVHVQQRRTARPAPPAPPPAPRSRARSPSPSPSGRRRGGCGARNHPPTRRADAPSTIPSTISRRRPCCLMTAVLRADMRGSIRLRPWRGRTPRSAARPVAPEVLFPPAVPSGVTASLRSAPHRADRRSRPPDHHSRRRSRGGGPRPAARPRSARPRPGARAP